MLRLWISILIVCLFNSHDASARFLQPILKRHSFHNRAQSSALTKDYSLRIRGGSLPTTSSTSSSSPSTSAGNTSDNDALWVLNLFDLFGTSVFAFSGAVTAGKRGMDLLGMTIVACITSIGGGTVRDILLGSVPVFWINEIIYLEICVAVAILTYFIWPLLEDKFNWKDSATIVCVADAVGLAAFAIIGTAKALNLKLSSIICILSGLSTATFGGVTRDVLCQQRPRIMYPQRTMYAPPAILGSIVYIFLSKPRNILGTTLSTSTATYASFLVAFITRLLSFNNPRRLPHWK